MRNSHLGKERVSEIPFFLVSSFVNSLCDYLWLQRSFQTNWLQRIAIQNAILNGKRVRLDLSSRSGIVKVSINPQGQTAPFAIWLDEKVSNDLCSYSNNLWNQLRTTYNHQDKSKSKPA